MRDITYRCNFCRDILSYGYGINWTGSGGGNQINLVTTIPESKQLENHLCVRCVKQIAAEWQRVEKAPPVQFEAKP